MPSRARAAATAADRTVPEARIAIRLKPTATKATRDPDDSIRQVLARPLTVLRVSVRIDPLLRSVTPDQLADMIRRARELDPTYTPPRLEAWRQVVLRPKPNARLEAELVDGLVRHLQKLDAVDSVYAMRAGPPPALRPGNDPRSARQGYLDPAPRGIDARYAWANAGATGAGVGFVDLEQGWKLDHKDLVDAGITLISGVNKDYRPHGTRVLAPVGNAVVLNTILLYEGNSCWYVNEGQNWWAWCGGQTTFRVRLRKNGSVQAVARKIRAAAWDDLDTVDAPGNVTLKDACTIRDGTPIGAPPAPCRWAIQGGRAYRIC
jgi:hypothetical protein